MSSIEIGNLMELPTSNWESYCFECIDSCYYMATISDILWLWLEVNFLLVLWKIDLYAKEREKEKNFMIYWSNRQLVSLLHDLWVCSEWGMKCVKIVCAFGWKLLTLHWEWWWSVWLTDCSTKVMIGIRWRWKFILFFRWNEMCWLPTFVTDHRHKY